MQKWVQNLKSEKGFTLIELLGVGVIIAILAAAAVPTIMGAVRSTRMNMAVDTASQIANALHQFYADSMNSQALGSYPTGTITDDKDLDEVLEEFWDRPTGDAKHYQGIQYSSTDGKSFTLCIEANLDEDIEKRWVKITDTGDISKNLTSCSGT